MSNAPGIMDEQAAAMAQVANVIAQMVVSLGGTVAQDKLMHAVRSSLAQQEPLGAVIGDATDPKLRAKHPEWGVKLRNKATGEEGIIRVPKDFAACERLDEVMHYVTLMGLLTNPAPRALLHAHGYELEFFQAGSSKPVIAT